MEQFKNITRLYNVAYRSIFTFTGKLSYDRVTDCLIKLANEIMETDTDESLWGIAEFDEAGLDGLVIGAYWHFTQWHTGMSSKGYRALCELGRVYSPGMETGPETETREHCAYVMLEEMAEQQYGKGE
jgi:hypothetical protein